MHTLKKRPGYIPTIDPEVTDAIKHKLTDICYGTESPNQKLDIYYPDMKADAYPVIIYFHGGGFELGEKNDEDLEPMLCALKRGYILVSADYRKSSEAHFPAALYDAKAVIRFVKAEAKTYGFGNKIGLWGPSSGGWLVSMLGVTAGNPAFTDLNMGYANADDKVDAVLDWCGPCGDFYLMDQEIAAHGIENRRPHSDVHSPESRFLGANIADVKELCRLACPITYVHEDMPPFMIIHGTADQVVPVEQSIDFANAIEKNAGKDKIRLYLGEGKPHHGGKWYTEDDVIKRSLDFFDQYLKK